MADEAVFVDTTVEPGVTLTQDGNNWTLNFGTVDSNFVTEADINLVNNTPANENPLLDLDLKAQDSVTPSPDGGFIQEISDIGAGSIPPGGSANLADISPDTSVLGPHTEFINISVATNSAFGILTPLPDITLTVTEDVVLPIDIFWQNRSSGQASVWKMDGNSLVGGGGVSPNPGPAWSEVGTGDFNGDGQTTFSGRTRTRARPRSGRWTETP
jgi:hypothetical protein